MFKNASCGFCFCSFALFVSACVFLVLMVLQIAPAAFAKDELKLESLQLNGRKRSYYLHLPGGNAAPAGRALVLVLHGGMENGKVIAKMSRMNEVSDKEGFLLVYPNGSGKLKSKFLTWNAYDCCGLAVKENVDDIAFISCLIEKMKDQFQIDPGQVFVAGYSNGAMLALRLACELSTQVAAVASVGGSMSGKEKLPEQPVSVLLIHGTDDRHVPYEGGKGKWSRFGYPVNEKPVSYALEFWRKANSCSKQAQQSESRDLKIESYNGRLGSELKLITLKNARHTWPGGKQSWLYSDRAFPGLDASKECWEFFQKHPRKLESN